MVIEELLEDLPEAHRRMIELRIEGHEVNEIAAAVQRSKRSVERVLQDFRQRLDALIGRGPLTWPSPRTDSTGRASARSSRRTSRPWPATTAPSSPTSPRRPTTPSGWRSSASWSASTWNTAGSAASPAGWSTTARRSPTLFEDRDLVHAMAFEEYRLRLQAGEGPTPAEYRRRFGIEGGDWPSSPPLVPSERPTRPTPPGDGAAEMERAASAYRAYRGQGPGRPEELNSLLDSFGVPAEHAELLRSLDRTDPHAAERLAEALAGLPPVGGRLPRLPPLRRAGPGGVRPRLSSPARATWPTGWWR